MKFVLLACFALLTTSVFADTPEVAIPEQYISVIKGTDLVEVTGTNDMGGKEDFSIHNVKAIGEFVQFLTSPRYNAVLKSPKLKLALNSLASSYKVRLSSNGALVLEFQVINDSIIDLPVEKSYYSQSARHSDNIMAPLLRLR